MSVNAQPVEVTLGDETIVRGLQWGDGPDWVILLHDQGDDRDLDDWRPLLPAIMTPERTLLTFDLPGHGASEGEPDADRLGSDLDRLLDHANGHGADWIALAGAGQTARQLLEKSGERSVDALVLLTPELSEENARQLRGKGEPKLFAVGSRDETRVSTVRQARNRSIGWAMLVSLPTAQQGTDLLAGAYSSQLIERIVVFLAEQRMLARMLREQLSQNT